MWDAFKDLIFGIIEFFYNLLGGTAGGDWGMAIIIVTIIFRLVMSPFMYIQARSSFRMQKIQPRVAEIQQRFPDDPLRQQEEMQKLYAEAKFNPVAGCLPMLFQLPIFMGLFQVLRNMSSLTQGTSYEFYSIIPSLVTSPSEALAQGAAVFTPYIVLLLIFAFSTFIPMLLQQRNGIASQKNQMLIIGGVMSLFMLWIGWNSPAGVLLFWGTSSILAIAQQQFFTTIFRRRDNQAEEEVIEVKPLEVNVTRKVKKPRPTKKSK